MPKIVNHEERRERIAEIVAGMMATVGVEHTTIREISRQSGYSRGFIEHYFQSKEELVSSALKWINQKSLDRAEEQLKGKKGLAALRALNEVTLPMSDESRKEWKVRMQFWGLAAVNPEHKKEQSKRMYIVEKMFVQYLEEAADLGEIEKDDNLVPKAHSLLHRMYGLSCNAILRPSYFTKDRQIQALNYIMSELEKTS